MHTLILIIYVVGYVFKCTYTVISPKNHHNYNFVFIKKYSIFLVIYWLVGSVTWPENNVTPVKLSLIININGRSHVKLGFITIALIIIMPAVAAAASVPSSFTSIKAFCTTGKKNIYKIFLPWFHSKPENLKNSRQKNSWNQKKNLLAFFLVLNFFLVQKLIFGHFWNCKKGIW